MDAFYAVRNTTTKGSNATVSFSNVYKTPYSNFQLSNMSLSNPSLSTRSLYWMHIAVDALPFTPTTLQLSDKSISVYVNQTTTNIIVTFAMGGVIAVQPKTQLNLIASSNSSAIYWSAFRIDNLFCPLIAFRVVRTTQMAAMGQVTFDVVLLNEGNAWNVSANKFVTPYNGIYLFSFSGGIRYLNGIVINLNCNGSVIRRVQGAYGDLFSAGVDMMSKTAILSLTAANVIHISYVQKSILYSDATYHQVTFSGFYYNPIHKQPVSYSILYFSLDYIILIIFVLLYL